MFNLNAFIMNALNGMVGNLPDFQIRQFALNWYGKGKLTEEDLALVEEWLAVPAETPAEETVVDETPAEDTTLNAELDGDTDTEVAGEETVSE